MTQDTLDTVVTGSKLTAIANAIRTRGGTQAQLTLDEMPAAVEAIPGGGGGGGFDWSQIKHGIQFLSASSSYPSVYTFDGTGLDTATFKTFESMFKSNNKMQHCDLWDCDTSSVTSMSSMFQYCAQLVSVNLSGFETASVLSMQNMFQQCPLLTTLIWSQKSTVQPIPNAPRDIYINGSSLRIYVPDALVSAYRSASNWSVISDNIYSINNLPSNIAAIYDGHY